MAALPRPPSCCVACSNPAKLQSSPPKFPLIPCRRPFSPLLPPLLRKEPGIRRAAVMFLYIYAMDAGKARPYFYTSSSSSSCPIRRRRCRLVLFGLWREEIDMGRHEMLKPLGFLVAILAFSGGTVDQRRAEAAAADEASPHRLLATVSVSKPSYPTVTTPMSAYADQQGSAPGSPASTFPSLAAGNGGGGGTWCVASQSANPTALQVALDYACGYGADCSAIQQGGSCFNPDTVRDHASYAFNSYYQKNPAPTSCDFGGTATITNTDPSSGSCQYPASSGGGAQNTMPPPSPTTLLPPTVPTYPPMTPTPTTPDTTTPTTGTPVYGMSPPDYGGSTSPPGGGSTSPPDYGDVGAAAVTGQGRVALALLCVLVATISLHVAK